MLRPLLYVGILITRKDSRTMLSEQVHETFVVSGLTAPTLEEHSVGERPKLIHQSCSHIAWRKDRRSKHPIHRHVWFSVARALRHCMMARDRSMELA